MFVIREETSIPGVRFLKFEGRPTSEDLDAYFAEEETRAATTIASPTVVVIQISEVWPSPMRKKMRDWDLKMSAKGNDSMLGMAMVVPNAIIRGAFTAYFWLAPPDYPTQMVPNAAAAFDFAIKGLSNKSSPLPPREEFVRVAESVWPGKTLNGQKLVSVDKAS